jgi:S-(hydroxymethyl)glutathione synthase
LLDHPAYVAFDQALKARAEAMAAQTPELHNSINTEVRAPASSSTLQCLCADSPVTVAVAAPIVHNHLCGCSKCWKPAGALLAQTAVVAADAATVLENEIKLAVVDPSLAIKRHACGTCGAHMIGTVEDPEHHFFGLTFVHPELATEQVVGRPEFAGFVSSVVETGTCAADMEAIRGQLAQSDIPSYDAFSPEIMDIIAYHKRKIASTTSHRSSAA